MSSLELGTQGQNIADKMSRGRQARGERAGHAKLTAETVREIRRSYAAGEATQYELADRFGIAQPSVGHIIQRRTWRHV